MSKTVIDTPQSSNISRYEYEDETKSLTVTFAGGNKYRYADVPPNLIDELGGADSVGKFFSANIRNHFSFEQLVERCPHGCLAHLPCRLCDEANGVENA